MKILKLVPLIVLFFFAPGNKIYAQSRDYVITNKGDTLKGQFTSGKKFKADGWDKAKRINADEYKDMFHADDSVYGRAVFLPGSNTPEFVAMYEKGKIDLYTKLVYQHTEDPYQPAGSPGNLYGFNNNKYIEHLYVAKGNDSLKELVYAQIFKSSKKRMDVLGELLMDNKDVYDKFIADDKLTPKQIRNIIHLYNTGKPYVEMHRPQPKEDASNDFNPSQN